MSKGPMMICGHCPHWTPHWNIQGWGECRGQVAKTIEVDGDMQLLTTRSAGCRAGLPVKESTPATLGNARPAKVQET